MSSLNLDLEKHGFTDDKIAMMKVHPDESVRLAGKMLWYMKERDKLLEICRVAKKHAKSISEVEVPAGYVAIRAEAYDFISEAAHIAEQEAAD